MIVSPISESRDETQPGPTTYSRRTGMTTGPAPKVRMPARHMFVSRNSERGAEDNVDREMSKAARMPKVEMMIAMPRSIVLHGREPLFTSFPLYSDCLLWLCPLDDRYMIFHHNLLGYVEYVLETCQRSWIKRYSV